MILIFIVLVLSLILFFDNYIRIYISLKTLAVNIAYYFLDFFVDTEEPQQVLDVLITNNGGSISSLLPIDFEVFKERFLLSFRLMINRDVFNIWSAHTINSFLTVLNAFIMMLNVAMIIVFYSIFTQKAMIKRLNSMTPEEFKNYYPHSTSKAYDLFLKIKGSKAIERTKNFLYSIYNYLFTPKFFKFFVIMFVLFITKLINIPIDLLSCYFNLTTYFNFNILWKTFIVMLIDIAPLLLSIPLFIQLIIIYIAIDKLRIKAGFKKLERNEKKNVDYLKTTGNAIMITGASGKGKTRMVVDMAMTSETILRESLLDIMHEIQRKFYTFNFARLERLTSYLVNTNQVNNIIEIERFVDKEKQFYNNKKNCKLIDCFYDSKNNKLTVYDELTNENIFDAIKDYMKAYYYYSLSDTMIMGNVAISSSMTVSNDKKLYKCFSPDYFKSGLKDLENRSMSINFNWDWLRLNKRFKAYNSQTSFVPSFGVFAFSEVGKERGSFESNRSLDTNSDKPNPKNDMLPVEQRIHRHKASLRHRVLFKEFFDEQRPEQLDPDLRRIMETIIILDKDNMKEKTSLKAWRIERRFCEVVISIFNKYSDWRKEANQRVTIPYMLFNSFVGKINRYYIKRINLFNYTEVKMNTTNGSIENTSADNADNSKVVKYYLSNKKDFANRYDSEYLKKVFENEILNSSISILNVPRYKSFTPTFKELDYQESYLFKQLQQLYKLKK